MNRPSQATGGARWAVLRASALAALAASVLLLGALIAPARTEAAPFVWDHDDDGIDDRIETVHVLGYTFSFEGADSLARQRFVVLRSAGDLLYGVYVVFDHDPTTADLASVTALGMPVLHRYEAVPALRSLATFAQVQAARALPGVERIEAMPLLYPVLRDGAADIGVRDASGQVFPTWDVEGGADGAGVVLAFLDTGVNDAADGAYPGHESLAGRCLGGAQFTSGDSALDTPRDGSVNPVDRGELATQSHGTHVAAIALGSGGASGYAVGVAPAARFVDVKVLNDAGVGTGVGEGLDWCIHNRARDWGAPGYPGIHVINLSLSSLDESDGNDVVSQLAARAAQLGMVVVASAGNQGKDQFVPSPAGGDGVLAVGAMDDQRTGLPGDDQFASFSDYGPRTSDGDADSTDEQKPDLLAPGVAVLSADGSLSGDGAQYQRLSGTSMATAFVSGVAAALHSQDATLTPAAIAELLRATARRTLAGTPAGTGGADPRWRSPIGWGVVDLHAARLELVQPQRSQVDRLELAASGPAEITAVLRTQRERGAAHFVFERAPDLAGAPGAFAPYDSVAAAGDSSLAGPVNRTSYARVWSVPEPERGMTFWYRIACTEDGVRWSGPARAFTSPVGPSVATIELTIVHSAYDHDVTGLISAGNPAPGPALPAASSGATTAYTIPLPGSTAAVASDWVTGESTTGNVSWTFRIEVPAGTAESYLPPTPANPWWLRVDDGGYVNRSGRVTDYRLTWHAPGGDQTWVGGPLPQPTLEGGKVHVAVPQGVVGVEPPVPSSAFRYGPNPVTAGRSVAFALPRAPRGDLLVFDLAGRQVGRAPFVPGAAGVVARWEARDAGGEPLPSGVYFARAGAAAFARLVVLRR